MKFSIQKNGYNKEEVDKYFEELNNEKSVQLAEKEAEIDKLKTELLALQNKSDSIALALTAAIEKAKDIEESSKNIYKLKIEQLTILYSKWEMLLNEMLRKYPAVNGISNVKEDMIKLKNSISAALKDDFNVEIMKTNPATDPIRTLLNKLTGMKARNLAEMKHKEIKLERKSKVSVSDKTELVKLEEKAPNIKPIINIELTEKDNGKYDNLVDKFLDTDEENDSAFAKTLTNKNNAFVPNESGFDLNECINPTDDLTEIMKSFDFYTAN